MQHIPYILIVDDDSALLQALSQAIVLRLGQARVDTVASAQEALRCIKEHDYDAIISDIKMPGMDGLMLLAKIQEIRPDTPTLLVTGHGEQDLTIQALRGGAYDFIQKPVERDYFVVAIKRAIQTRQLRRQVAEQQQVLEQHAQTLERQVMERTRELVFANAAKDEFLSMASHELKTPLCSLKGMTQLLRRRLERLASPEVKNVASMERSIVRMEVLIQDLLDTSLIELGRFTLRLSKHDIVELCQHVVREYATISTPAPLLVLNIPAEVISASIDATRISQVLLNLLSNAHKYSAQDAPITITVRRVNNKGMIAVQDKGVGISEEQLPHIFERFYRTPEVSVQTGSSVGLGLGLYISQKIIDAHGGSITVHSVPGEGSTFTIMLPLLIGEMDSEEMQAASHS